MSDRTIFRYYNCNPKRRITDDCYLRAIATGEGKSWEQVLKELVELTLKEGYIMGDEKLYSKYLIANGWVKQRQPVKPDGKKYKIKEFLETSGFKGHAIVNSGAAHLTYFDDGYCYDIFDCTDRVMNCYWVHKDEIDK